MLHSIAIALSLLAADPEEEADLIPHMDDEISLVRVMASPEAYVGKVFIICVSVRVKNDNYSGFYKGAVDTHYQLDAFHVGKYLGSGSTEQRAYLFLPKKGGDPIVAPILKKQETKGGTLVARCKVYLRPESYAWEGLGVWGHLELLDIQFIQRDLKSWQPWVLHPEPTEAQRREEAKAAEAERLAAEAARQARAPKFREWTDNTGKHKTKAKFVRFAVGTVTLELESGKTVDVALERLSKEDQDYIKQRRSSAR